LKVTLKPSWELTTELAASSYGQPVLVNRGSGEAFGPGDIIRPYPSWSFMTAQCAVQRMAATKKLTAEQQDFVRKFAGVLGPACRPTDLLKLKEYGGRLIEMDDRIGIELIDPNDNAQRRFQYRREGEGLVRRVLQADGRPFEDGSPWEPCDLNVLRGVRGTYHPILDPLGF